MAFDDIQKLRAEHEEYDEYTDMEVAEAYFNRLVTDGDRKEEDRNEFFTHFLRPSISPNDKNFNNVYSVEAFRERFPDAYTEKNDQELGEALVRERKKQSPFYRSERDVRRQIFDEFEIPFGVGDALSGLGMGAATTFTQGLKGLGERIISDGQLSGNDVHAVTGESFVAAADAAEEWFKEFFDWSEEDMQGFGGKAGSTIGQMGAFIGVAMLPGVGIPAMGALSFGVHQAEAAERAKMAGATPEQMGTALNKAVIPAIAEFASAGTFAAMLRPVVKAVFPKLKGTQLDKAVEAVEKVAKKTQENAVARLAQRFPGKYTVGGAVGEGIQEGFSEVLHNWIEQGYNPDPNLGLMDGALESAAWGAFGGGFFGGIRDAYDNNRSRNRRKFEEGVKKQMEEFEKSEGASLGTRRLTGAGAMRNDLRDGHIAPGATVYVSDDMGYATIPAEVVEVGGTPQEPYIVYRTADGEGTIDPVGMDQGQFLLANKEEAPEVPVTYNEEDKRFLSGLDQRKHLLILYKEYGDAALRLEEGKYETPEEMEKDLRMVEETIQEVEKIRKKLSTQDDISYANNEAEGRLNKFLMSWVVDAESVVAEQRKPAEEKGEVVSAENAQTTQETETAKPEPEPELEYDVKEAASLGFIDQKGGIDWQYVRKLIDKVKTGDFKTKIFADTVRNIEAAMDEHSNNPDSTGKVDVLEEKVLKIMREGYDAMETKRLEAMTSKPAKPEPESKQDDKKDKETPAPTEPEGDSVATETPEGSISTRLKDAKKGRETVLIGDEAIGELEDNYFTAKKDSGFTNIAAIDREEMFEKIEAQRANKREIESGEREAGSELPRVPEIEYYDNQELRDVLADENAEPEERELAEKELVRRGMRAEDQYRGIKPEGRKEGVTREDLLERKEEATAELQKSRESLARARDIDKQFVPHEDPDTLAAEERKVYDDAQHAQTLRAILPGEIENLEAELEAIDEWLAEMDGEQAAPEDVAEAGQVVEKLQTDIVAYGSVVKAAAEGPEEHRKVFAKAMKKAIRKAIKKHRGTRVETMLKGMLVKNDLNPDMFNEGYFEVAYHESLRIHEEKQQDATAEDVWQRSQEGLTEAIKQATADLVIMDSAMQTAFTMGWQHSLTKGTASNLPTGGVEQSAVPAMKAGYEAGVKWKKENPDAFTSKGKKQEGVGKILKRIRDLNRGKKDNETDNETIERVGSFVDGLLSVSRSDVFDPQLDEEATPGAQRMIDWLAKNLRTPFDYIEYRLAKMDDPHYFPSRRYKNRDAVAYYILYYAHYPRPSRVKDWNNPNYFDDINPEGQEERMEQLQTWVEEYIKIMGEISKALEGELNVEAMAAMFTEEFTEKNIKPMMANYYDAKNMREHLIDVFGKDDEQREYTSSTTKRARRPKLDRINRKGLTDHRKGENKTFEDLVKSFGLEGASTGKSVTSEQQQDHINYLYDALMDLAHVLGINPKQIGFGGRLRITIGQLGAGRHSAHFSNNHPIVDENDNLTGETLPVINITNTRGDGSLAHEYGHALDFMFRNSLGEEHESERMAQAVATIHTALSRDVAEPSIIEETVKMFLDGKLYYPGIKRYKIRQIWRWFEQVEAGFFWLEKTGVSSLSQTSSATKYKTAADWMGEDYWGNKEEMFARAFESWVYDTLNAMKAGNDYLVSEWVQDGYVTKEAGYKGTPYPEGEERKMFGEIFDLFVSHLSYDENGYPTVDEGFYDEVYEKMGFAELRKKFNEVKENFPETQEEHERQEQEREEARKKEQEEAARAEREGDEEAIRALAEKARQEEPEPDLPDPDPETPPNSSPADSTTLDEDAIDQIVDNAVAQTVESQQEKTEEEIKTAESKLISTLASELAQHFKDNKPMRNRRLIELASAAFGGSLSEETFDHRKAYDSLEVAFGKAVTQELSGMPSNTPEEVEKVLRRLDELIRLLPVQNKRTKVQEDYQQFSTPPTIGFLMAWVANITGKDVAMEPSAGTGLLGRMINHFLPRGLILNELEKSRLQMLRSSEIAGATIYQKDAIILHSMLPLNDVPTVVVMNPAFSADPNIPGARHNKVGTSQIEQALLRLADGGRLVVLVGKGMAHNKPQAKAWFDKIKKEYTVRANIGLSGASYKQFGTTFDNQIIVIDKIGPQGETEVVTGSFKDKDAIGNLVKALTKLTEIRDERVHPGEQIANQPDSKRASEGSLAADFVGSLPDNADVGDSDGGREPGADGPSDGEGDGRGQAGADAADVADDGGAESGSDKGADRKSRRRRTKKSPLKKKKEELEKDIAEAVKAGNEMGVDGLGDLARGLLELSKPDPNKMNMALIPIDPEQYAKAKPLFQSMWPKFVQSASSYKEAITKSVEWLNVAIASKAEDLKNIAEMFKKWLKEEILPGLRARGQNINDKPSDAFNEPAREESAVESSEEQEGAWTQTAEEAAANDGWAPVISAVKKIGNFFTRPHREVLMEGAALALQKSPTITYKPAFGDLVGAAIESGQVSDVQLEGALLALQAQEQILGDGETRKGYLIGDGTGLGKMRELLLVVLENWVRGRKKHIFISKNVDILRTQAVKDLMAVTGWDKKKANAFVASIKDESSANSKIGASQGMLAYTYRTLAQPASASRMQPVYTKIYNDAVERLMTETNMGRNAAENIVPSADDYKQVMAQVPDPRNEGEVIEVLTQYRKQAVLNLAGAANMSEQQAEDYIPKFDGRVTMASRSRLDQLIEWIMSTEGRDWDGTIVFDEAHELGSSLNTKEGRGEKEVSQQAQAAMELQRHFPKARVLYLSATAAEEMHKMSFAVRLGLWGRGTAFPDVRAFVNSIAGNANPIAAMEFVAQNMKSLGAYVARHLSYAGVEYRKLVHDLTDDQIAEYNVMADSWQMVLNQIEAAIADNHTDPKERGKLMSLYWGANQRFFGLYLTELTAKTLFADIDAKIAEGGSIVVQLVNTGGAALQREVEIHGERNVHLYNLSPIRELSQLVEKYFPVQQYREVVDDDTGKVTYEPVFETVYNEALKKNVEVPVTNPESVKKRDKLLDELAGLTSNNNILDQIIERYGKDNVAEITGRNQRIVIAEEDDPNGKYKAGQRILEKNRGIPHREKEAAEFQAGLRNIAVFSDAGGTGIDLHADLNAKNQKKRYHYGVQTGWSAKKFIQGLGRTHRSNQAQPPEQILVTTNIKGQMRFISTIARRLNQMGALTSGERKTGSRGVVGAEDDIDTPEAKEALSDLLSSGHELVSEELLNEEMGLGLDVIPGRVLNPEKLNLARFYNRILTLRVERQEAVFSAFIEHLERIIHVRTQEGTMDLGITTYAKGFKGIESVNTGHTDAVLRQENAEGDYVEVHVERKQRVITLSEYFKDYDPKGNDGRSLGQTVFLRNKRSKQIWAVWPLRTTGRWGSRSPATYQPREFTDLFEADNPSALKPYGNWERVDPSEVERLWQEDYDKAPKTKTQTYHMLRGTLLPVWDKLPKAGVQLVRVFPDDGPAFVAMQIPTGVLRDTLKKLGVNVSNRYTPRDIQRLVLEEGAEVYLTDGWLIRRAVTDGETRMEVIQAHDEIQNEWEQIGLMRERHDYRFRFFIPTGRTKVIEKLVDKHPVEDVVEREGETRIMDSRAEGSPAEKRHGYVRPEKDSADIQARIDKLIGRTGGMNGEIKYGRGHQWEGHHIKLGKSDYWAQIEYYEQTKKVVATITDGKYGEDKMSFYLRATDLSEKALIEADLQNMYLFFDLWVREGKKPEKTEYKEGAQAYIKESEKRVEQTLRGDSYDSVNTEGERYEMEASLSQMGEMLWRMIPRDVKVEVQEEKIEGRALGRISRKEGVSLLELSLSGNPVMTLHHETVHILRNLFTGNEWLTLIHEAHKKDWIGKYKIAERYPEYFHAGKPTNKAYEEAIADAFGEWGYDMWVKPRLKRAKFRAMRRKWGVIHELFTRMMQVIDNIARILRKNGQYQAVGATEIFERISRGDVGNRVLRIGNPTDQNIEASSVYAGVQRMNLYAMRGANRGGVVMLSSDMADSGDSNVHRVSINPRRPVIVRVPDADGMAITDKMMRDSMQKAVEYHRKKGRHDAVIFVTVSPFEGISNRVIVAAMPDGITEAATIEPFDPGNGDDAGWINRLNEILITTQTAQQVAGIVDMMYRKGTEAVPPKELPMAQRYEEWAKEKGPVLDKDGNPVNLWHGTSEDFDEFDNDAPSPYDDGEKALRTTVGTWLSTHQGVAMDFGVHGLWQKAHREEERQETAHLEGFLEYEDIRHAGHIYDDMKYETPPKTMKLVVRGKFLEVDMGGKANATWMGTKDGEKVDATIRKAMKEGYDGVVFRNFADNPPGTKTGHDVTVSDQYLVFDPANIRSVDAVFDPARSESRNIFHSIAGEGNPADIERGRPEEILDAEMERQKDIKPKNLLEKWRDSELNQNIKETFGGLTLQVSKHLPSLPEFEKFRSRLGNHQAVLMELQEKASTAIGEWIEGLDKESFDQYARIVIMRDYLWDKRVGKAHWMDAHAEQDGDPPLSMQEIEDSISRLYRTASPETLEAIRKRTEFMDRLRVDLVKEGILTKKEVANEDYFRHIVMEFHDFSGKRRVGRKLRQSARFKREGTEKEFLLDVLDVDFKTVVTALKDIATAQFLNYVRRSESINVAPMLHRMAKGKNNDNIMEVMRREARALGLTGDFEGETPRDVARAIGLAYRKKKRNAESRQMKLIDAPVPDRIMDKHIVEMGKAAPLTVAWLDSAQKIHMGRQILVRVLANSAAFKKGTLPRVLAEFVTNSEARIPFYELEEFANNLRDEGKEAMANKIEMAMATIYKGFGNRASEVKKRLGDKVINTRDLKKTLAGLKAAGVKEVGIWDIDNLDIWQAESDTNNAFHLLPAKELVGRIQKRVEKELFQEDADEVMSVVRDTLAGVMIKGGPKEQMVLPQEVAKTLTEFSDVNLSEGMEAMAQKFTRVWKPYILHSPMFILRYSFYNLLGDTDALIGLMGAHRVPFYLNRGTWAAAKRIADGKPKGELEKMFMKYHGHSGTWTAGDLTAPTKTGVKLPIKDSLLQKTAHPVSGYFKQARYVNQVRENAYRFAAYKYALEQIRANKTLPEIGAFAVSKAFRQAAAGKFDGGKQALPTDLIFNDEHEMAVEISRQTLVPYDRPPEYIQKGRNFTMPFIVWLWSVPNRYLRGFAEVYRLARGRPEDIGDISKATARFMAAKSLARMMTFAAVTTAIWYGLDDEEEPMQEWLNENNAIRTTLWGLLEQPVALQMRGAFPDFLRWVGFSNPAYTFQRMSEGKISATHVPKEFVNTLFGGVTPALKLPFEVAMGQRLFPDLTEPRQISDMPRHIFGSFGMRWAWDTTAWAFGNDPGYSVKDPLTALLGTLFKPVRVESNSLYESRDRAYRYAREVLGKNSPAGVDYANPEKSIAVKSVLQAYYAGDSEAMKRAVLAAYEAETGERTTSLSKALGNAEIRSAISGKVEGAAPMSPIPKKDRRKFRESLDERGVTQMEIAEDFHKKMAKDIGRMIRSKRIVKFP